jgi:superkiller protein 3
VLVLLLAACSEPPPPAAGPPAPDTSAMEPQVAEKIEAARQRVLRSAGYGDAWGDLGMVFQAHALYPEAIACYRRAMELSARDFRWPYLAALAQQKIEMAGALDYFAAAERLLPESPAFHVSHGNALFQLGELDRALAQYERALEIDPSSTHALYGLGQVELARGETTAALEHLRTAADLAPHHGEVQGLLAQVHHRLGNAEDARLAELRARAFPEATRAPDPVTEAMEAEAATSRSFTDRGLALTRQGRFDEAEAAFRRVLEIRPGNALDHVNLGGALARQGKLDEAVAAYREAVALDPREPSARNNFGMALADLGRLEEGAAELEEAIRLEPSYAEAEHNLGLVRYRQGRVDEALEHYAGALELEPGFADAHVQTGTALAAQGRLGEAAEHWRQALALDGRNLSALFNLTMVLARRGEHGEAIAWLEEGLRVAPNSSRLASMLAWELATAPDDELRDGDRAVQLARRIWDAYPDQASAADVLAAAHAEAGDFEEAVRVAERALELARASGQAELVRQVGERLSQYRSRQPHRPSEGGE